jgi:hypothetical protein
VTVPPEQEEEKKKEEEERQKEPKPERFQPSALSHG